MGPKRVPNKKPSTPSSNKQSKTSENSTPTPRQPSPSESDATTVSGSSPSPSHPIEPAVDPSNQDNEEDIADQEIAIVEAEDNSSPKQLKLKKDGTPKKRNFDRDNEDEDRVSLKKIDKVALRPYPTFPAVNKDEGKASQFPKSLRMKQKDLQASHQPRPYNKRWGNWSKKPNPTREARPTFDSDRQDIEVQDEENPPSITTLEERSKLSFKELSELQNKQEQDRKDKRKPRTKKPVNEATFLDMSGDDLGGDDDGGQGFDGIHLDVQSDGQTSQPKKFVILKVPIFKSTGNLVDSREDHGVTPEMREAYAQTKQKEAEAQKKADLAEAQKRERIKHQYEAIKNRGRKQRSKSMDALDDKGNLSFKSRGRTSRSPPNLRIPPFRDGGTPSPPVMVRVAAGVPQSNRKPHSTPTQPPKQNVTPVKSPVKRISNRNTEKGPGYIKKLQENVIIVPEKPKKAVGKIKEGPNNFPRVEAFAWFRKNLMAWDSEICDKVEDVLRDVELELTENDRMALMQISEEHEALMSEINSTIPPTLANQERIKICNDNTADMIIGLVTCVVDKIYRKKKNYKLTESRRSSMDLEDRAVKLINPNDVLHRLFPVLTQIIHLMQSEAPFLQDNWVERVLGLEEGFKGPGIRLAKAFRSTALNNIVDYEDSVRWRNVGEHLLNVEDGKSLYPKQMMTDITMSALLHIKCERSREDKRMVPSHYIATHDLDLLNRLRSTNGKSFNENLAGVVDSIQQVTAWDQIFGAIHLHDKKHWMILRGNFASRTVEIFDTFQSDALVGKYFHARPKANEPVKNPEHNDLTALMETFRLIMEAVTLVPWCIGQDFPTMEFIKDPDIPIQKDEYSCGPICIVWTEKKMNYSDYFLISNRHDITEYSQGNFNVNVRLFREIESSGAIPVTMSSPHVPVNELPSRPPTSSSISTSSQSTSRVSTASSAPEKTKAKPIVPPKPRNKSTFSFPKKM